MDDVLHCSYEAGNRVLREVLAKLDLPSCLMIITGLSKVLRLIVR